MVFLVQHKPEHKSTKLHYHTYTGMCEYYTQHMVGCTAKAPAHNHHRQPIPRLRIYLQFPKKLHEINNEKDEWKILYTHILFMNVKCCAAVGVGDGRGVAAMRVWIKFVWNYSLLI